MQQAITHAKKHILLNLLLFSCATLTIAVYTSKIMANDIISGQETIGNDIKKATTAPSVVSTMPLGTTTATEKITSGESPAIINSSSVTNTNTSDKATQQKTSATEQSAVANDSTTREITTSGATKQVSTNLATTTTAKVNTTATNNGATQTTIQATSNNTSTNATKKNLSTESSLVTISPTFTFTSPQNGKTIQDKITISGTVDNAQNVEFYLIQENSDARKYIGTATKQPDNTWGMNFNLDNTPNGSFFLIAKIENVHTTYESGKIKITINSYPHNSTDNQTNSNNNQSTIIFESPKEKGPVEKDTYKVTSVSVVKVGTENRLKLEGKGLPNSFVTVYIYSSLPIILTVKTDSEGNWSYVLDKQLDDGEHEAYVAVTDNTGKITAKSEPLPFIKTAQAATIIDPANAAERAKASLPPTQTRTNSDMLIITAIILLSLGLVFSIISLTVVYKAEKKIV